MIRCWKDNSSIDSEVMKCLFEAYKIYWSFRNKRKHNYQANISSQNYRVGTEYLDQRKMILSLTSLVLKQSVEQSNVQDSKNLRRNFKFKGKALLLLTFCDQKLVFNWRETDSSRGNGKLCLKNSNEGYLKTNSV